jgi:hypothetical protein
MARIDLKVPFQEKDEAKRLGARWDPQGKIWFVPDGVDPEPCVRWMPKTPGVNYRSSHFFVASAPVLCWKCGTPTWVYAIALPGGHEQLDIDEDAEDGTSGEESWISIDEPAFLYYIDYLPTAVQDRVRALTRHFHVDYSKTTDSSYWMNHCEHCSAKQGDFPLFCEPGSPFVPMTESDAAAVTLQRASASFEAHADGYSYDPEFFRYMKRE